MRPLYLKTEDIPELKHLTKAQRTEVWVASAPSLFREPMTYLVLLGSVTCGGFGVFAGQNLLSGFPGVILGAVLCSTIVSSLFWYYSAEKVRPHLVKNIEKRKLNIRKERL